MVGQRQIGPSILIFSVPNDLRRFNGRKYNADGFGGGGAQTVLAQWRQVAKQNASIILLEWVSG